MKKYLFVLLLLFIAGSAFADTHEAASCSQAHIQTAIDASADDDIVSVPAGNCTWTGNAGASAYLSSAVYINDKRITLQGAGVGVTNITIDLTDAGQAPSGIYVNAATKAPKITGFSFITDGKMQSTEGGSIITLSKNSKDSTKVTGFRIYGNTFSPSCSWCTTQYNQTRCIGVFGYIYGLIDQNIITYDASGGVFIDVSEGQGETSGSISGDNSWNNALSLGGADAVYIENNTFNYANWSHGNVTDAGDGGRFVLRYNTIYNIKSECHSACSSGGRGTRSWEIYNNNFIETIGPTWAGAIFMRGGTGVIFNNTFTGRFMTKTITFDERRTDTAVGAGYPGCAANLRYRCDGNSALDENTDPIATYMGWPCLDQIGQSTGAEGNQASDPAYVWGNSLNGVARDTVSLNAALTATNPSQADHLKKDRDWFEGSAKDGYTAYTCPHPLAGAGVCTADVAGRDGYALGGEAPTHDITIALTGTGATMTTGTVTANTGGAVSIPVTRHNGWNGAWSTSDGTNCVVSACTVPNQGESATCSVTVNADCTVTYTATPIYLLN